MLSDFDSSLLYAAALVVAALGVVIIGTGIAALRRARPLGFTLRTLTGVLMIVLGALVGTIGVAMRGYRALTHEEVAATIEVVPGGPQQYAATVRIPGRPDTTYLIAGDAIYVDAHVLKWKPLVNVLGLHTAYELSRIAGRYDDVEQERTAERTVHDLSRDRAVDLFALRRRFAFLGALVDAEYGSGTFMAVSGPTELEVRVSTTGLLVREARTARR